MSHVTELPPIGYVTVAEHCCPPAEAMWAIEEVMVAALNNRPLPTTSIDAIPPGRARIVVQVCLMAGARLEQGDDDLFEQAAIAATHAGESDRWWSRALAAASRPVPTLKPRNASPRS